MNIDHLPRLSDDQLSLIHGCGGEITFSVTTPPVKGNIGLTYATPKTSLTGGFTLDGRTWGVGFTAAYNPSPNLGLQAYVRTDGNNHEVGISGRIRFFRA